MSEEKIVLKSFSDIPPERLAALCGKRVFFGHQSVGGNIMQGVEDLVAAHESLKLNIVKTKDLSGHEGPVFAHAVIGKNLDPKSKVDEFAALMRNGLKGKVDIAFFKLCYVDIRYNTDFGPIFEYYKSVMAGLKKEFPDVVFFHATVPYNVSSGGVKRVVKNLLGRDHNMKRSECNRLIRKAFGAGEIFDLAGFESTYADGRREKGGRNHYALVPGYSSSGGHLNKKGREVIAAQLLNFLAAL
ncbi:MAG: hypothetical protein GY950_25665 [bacterium]|nr:hypothetical protein [bacterium]